jgi:hypothetical protein
MQSQTELKSINPYTDLSQKSIKLPETIHEIIKDPPHCGCFDHCLYCSKDYSNDLFNKFYKEINPNINEDEIYKYYDDIDENIIQDIWKKVNHLESCAKQFADILSKTTEIRDIILEYNNKKNHFDKLNMDIHYCISCGMVFACMQTYHNPCCPSHDYFIIDSFTRNETHYNETPLFFESDLPLLSEEINNRTLILHYKCISPPEKNQETNKCSLQ